MKTLLLLLFLHAFSLEAMSRQPALYFEKLDRQHGLSHNKINTIIEDRRGFIWVGTDDGLNRFDGRQFVTFRRTMNDTASLSGNLVTDLLEDREGRLWIATADGGLCRYDYRLPPGKQFRHYPMQWEGRQLPSNSIHVMLEDRQGYLWLGTGSHGTVRFDKKTGQFRQLVPGSIRTILDLCMDREGNIWAGQQGGGLMKILPQAFTYEEDLRYRNLYAKLPHTAITALLLDEDQSMWIGSWDKVLYQQAAGGQKTSFAENGPYSFRNDEVLSFAQDARGNIWMGGKEKGLQIYDKSARQFYSYSYDPADAGSIADNQVNTIYQDRMGRIWIGTNRGLCINNTAKQQFRQTFLPRAGRDVHVYDFHERDDGTLLIGTSAGIYHLGRDGSMRLQPLYFRGVSLQVTSFYKNPGGGLFIGTDYSLFRWDEKRGLQWLPNTGKDRVMNRIIDSRVVSMVSMQVGEKPVLMVSPYGHFLAYYSWAEAAWVSRLDTAKDIIRNFNLRDNLVRKLYRTADGITWMATAKEGLGYFAKGEHVAHFLQYRPGDETSLANNNISDMAEDSRGNLWVSSYGGGLHCLPPGRKAFERIGASRNLVEGMAIDLKDRVWMVSNGQLQCYDPAQRRFTSYDLPDGEKTGGVKGRVFCDSRGYIFLSGLNYFIAFHPDSIGSLQLQPMVHLTDFSIFNKPYSHLLHQERIRLNWKQNYFTLQFAAPHFSFPSTLQYAYMLEGFDKDWVNSGERNFVSYSNLEGGTYTFKVRATPAPGSWGPEFTSLTITVVPPFWKTPLFYILCAITLGAGAYLIYRFRINEILERQAIRNKIAQDLHDNVGSTLSSISVYSQVAKIYYQQHKQDELHTTLEKISTTSGEMISELNDTVWAINPRNDQMGVILQRMESFARPLLLAQQTRLHLEHDKAVEKLNLSMEKRKNFFLLFKESINNALKYAGCSLVEVSVKTSGNSVTMRIHDNGRGFDLAKTSEGYKSSDVYGGGNGLRNMQLRAREMKGVLRIESAPGAGTTITLRFPIT